MPPNASDANMQTVAQVEFYWPTYNPVEAFDFFEQTPVENVILRAGVQIDYPGNTTGAVYEWMRVQRIARLRHKTNREPPLSPLARSLPRHVRPLNRSSALIKPAARNHAASCVARPDDAQFSPTPSRRYTHDRQSQMVRLRALSQR